MRRVEEQAARRLGGAAEPLLVSVRSGAPVSMPGMMDTILNLGLNAQTSAGLAQVTGSTAFASDRRDRFAATFRALIGREPPHDVGDQLRAALEAVFRSWNSERARAYRHVEGGSEQRAPTRTSNRAVVGK